MYKGQSSSSPKIKNIKVDVIKPITTNVTGLKSQLQILAESHFSSNIADVKLDFIPSTTLGSIWFILRFNYLK